MTFTTDVLYWYAYSSSNWGETEMAVLINGKPIDEVELPKDDGYERMMQMREYRRQKGWGQDQGESLQSGGHYAADTPRHWKHNRNMRA